MQGKLPQSTLLDRKPLFFTITHLHTFSFGTWAQQYNSVPLFSCEKQCGSLVKMLICLKGEEAGNDNDDDEFSMHMGKVKSSPTRVYLHFQT